MFQKIYGGARNDFPHALAPAADSGYVIAGYTNSFGNGGYDWLLTKVDKKGTGVWRKALGGTGEDILYALRKTSDGGFIACGQTKSYGNPAGDAWLIKFDASGNVQWSKKYGDGNVYGDAALDVTQLSDGGYALAGPHKWSPGVVDGFVVRTDAQGNVIWTKSYGNGNSDYPQGILEDGNFLLATGVYYGASFYDSYVMKLDKSNGAVQWIRGYDAENRGTWMNKITKTNTGYQVLSVVTDNFTDQNQQQCIWNLNPDGSVQNVRKLVIPGTWSVSAGWYPLTDGGFIATNGQNNNGSDVMVCRVNANGTLAFSKEYPMAGKQSISAITPTPDGGYALTGYTTNVPTVADSNNVCLLKIDSVGGAGSCSGINSSFTVITPSFATPTPDVVPLANVTINSVVITVGVVDLAPTTTTVCDACVAAASLTITATGTSLTLGCSPSASAIDAALGSASVTGGCGNATVISSTDVVQNSGCSRAQTRTFTATDSCGNIATASRTVTWTEDITPPVITTTGNDTPLGCNPTSAAIEAALGIATASDDCGSVTLTSLDGPVTGGCVHSQTRTFTATDTCGNITTASRTVTWSSNTTPPAITVTAGSSIIGCNPTAAAVNAALGIATASDDCGSVTITSADGPVAGGCVRSQTRTWTATDICGNIATASRTVTWREDLVAPALTASANNAPLGCNPTPAAINAALGSATGSDACGTPTLTSTDAVVQSNGCLRSQTRTWTATDICGNTGTASRTATWTEDLTPPMLTATGNDAPLGCNPTAAAINAAFGAATATDVCGAPTITVTTGAMSSNGCIRSQTRMWTATDICGNIATTSRTVTWKEDVIPPTVTCGANKTIDCTAPVEFDPPTATDNCDASSMVEVVSTSADGLTRTWRATDACGNTATCSQTITISACTPHIFPTATTCCHYVSGTAAQLQKVCYTKAGNSISKVIPGVFFYYSFVTAPASGPFVITVEQFNNNPDLQLFSVQNVSQVRLTDLNCGTGSIAFSGSIGGINNSQAGLTLTSYTPGATYVISIKYDVKSIIGSTFAGNPTAVYTFRSEVNGVVAPGSTGTLSAQSGCQDDTPNPPNNCQLATVALRAPEQSKPDPTINAYPNPFTDIVNFQISATVSGKVTLEVYNLQGQKLGIAFEGWMMAGDVKNVQYKSRGSSGGLIYHLSIGDKRMAGKVFRLK